MARVLVLYGTTEGQTASISEYIAEVVRDHGQEAETLDIEELPSGFALEAYDAAIIGASIHMGKHEEYVRVFVKRDREHLERMPSAFFSVSLAAREDTDEGRAQTQEYVEKFADEMGWHPDMVGIFAGALRYTQYGFVKRHLIDEDQDNLWTVRGNNDRLSRIAANRAGRVEGRPCGDIRRRGSPAE